MQQVPHRILLPVVLLTGLILRLFYIHAIRNDVLAKVLVIDARFYDAWAQTIARGNWLGREIFHQDPLYAYFLAVCYKLFGHSADFVRIIQAFLDTATIGLLYSTAALLFSPVVGITAACIAAFYGPLVYYTGLLDKTTFSIFLITLSLFLFSRAYRRPAARWSLLAGVANGLAALTRGNMLIVALALGAVLAWPSQETRTRLRRPLAFALGVLMIVGAVTLRNYIVGKDWVLLSSNSGLNLLIGNNPHTEGAYMEPPFLRGVPESEYADSREFAEHMSGRAPMKPSEVSGFYTRQVLKFVQEQPRRWSELMFQKLFLATNSLEIAETYSYYYFAEKYSPLRAAVIDFKLVFTLGILGAFMLLLRAGFNELHVFLFAYTVSLILFFVTSRYRLPLAIPLIIFGAWYAVNELPKCLTDKPRFVVQLFLAGALLLLCSWTPAWVKERVLNSTFATSHTVAGHTYCHVLGNFREGIREMETAKRIYPTSPDIDLQLAGCYDMMGDSAKALPHYLDALKFRPQNHEAWNNTGNIYFMNKNFRMATSAFAAALRLKPDHSVYRSNLEKAKKMLGYGQ